MTAKKRRVEVNRRIEEELMPAAAACRVHPPVALRLLH
jgi:hypothetical protein